MFYYCRDVVFDWGTDSWIEVNKTKTFITLAIMFGVLIVTHISVTFLFKLKADKVKSKEVVANTDSK
jgi:hypothetical protein